jgi:NAD(P)-dependent dehydrogenase (short-subunit alcohol dehydrogenase family)
MDDLGGYRFLVTGANTGIGRATAHALAARGGRVVLACRSEARTTPVIDAIREDTGNDAVEYLPLDLGDLDSVRTAAATLLDRAEPLHVLVNNAGVGGQRGQTTQGFELQFGVNHLGHFLLTTLLLDRLRESAPARIVNVSSDAHYRARHIDFAALQQATASVSGTREYGVSKLCNVLFTQELARRIPPDEVSAYALHPGVIASDIWRRIPWPARPVIKLVMKSPEEGAATSLYCATAPVLDGVSGRYYVNCDERTPSSAATEELGGELWQRSDDWTR